MRVLLAVGNEKTVKEISEHLINNGIEVRSCYNRIAVTAVAKEHRAEVVVLSPILPGDEDLVADIVQPLWNNGIRIVLLPGSADLPDTRDLIKKVIPYRVYDFVYDPVTPEKVLERLNNPGLPADLPKDLVKAAMLEETVSDTVPEAVSAEKGENRWGFLTKLAKKRRWKNAVQATETNARRRDGDTQNGDAAQSVPDGQRTASTLLPEERSASSFREKELSQREKRTDALPVYLEKRERIPEDFALLGSKRFPSFPALCADLPGDYSAVVIPSDLPDLAETIKQVRREPVVSALPIVVVGPCDAKECYAAGADECVEELSPDAVERIRAKAARMKKLWAEAERDPLTGLYNRRLLEKYMAEKEKQYKEKGVPFSVAVLDLDHFKRVNDTYGHDAGDTVLKEFAGFLAGKVRRVDTVARYGGEEFVIVFSGAGEAREIAERLCREWAKKEVVLPDGQTIKSTLSVGLAVAGKDADGAEELLKAADQALYRAKSSGRNMVLAVGERPPLPEENPVYLKLKGKSERFRERVSSPADLSFVIDEIKRHNVIVVWNLDSRGKAEAAVETAVSLKRLKRKVLLVEMDFLNPAVDRIAGIPIVKKKDIPGKTVEEIGAGLVTLGPELRPEYVPGLIRPKWGSFKVDYLAAGNDLGAVTDIYASEEIYRSVIALLARDYNHVVIDLGVSMEGPLFGAAMKSADVVVVPVPCGDAALFTRYEKIRATKLVIFVKGW